MIYLSGAMEADMAGGESWRAEFQRLLERCGYRVYNPYEHEDLSPYESPEAYFSDKGWVEPFLAVTRRFVERDMQAIEDSELVVFYFDGTPTTGGIGEITLARFLGKPVLLVLRDKTLRDCPAWMIGCATQHMTYHQFLRHYRQEAA